VDGAETTLSGSAFQMLAASRGKARLLIADSLKEGTTKWHSSNKEAVRYARRAVHTGPSLWGPDEPVLGRGGGGPFGILAHGPAPTLLRHWSVARRLVSAGRVNADLTHQQHR